MIELGSPRASAGERLVLSWGKPVLSVFIKCANISSVSEQHKLKTSDSSPPPPLSVGEGWAGLELGLSWAGLSSGMGRAVSASGWAGRGWEGLGL